MIFIIDKKIQNKTLYFLLYNCWEFNKKRGDSISRMFFKTYSYIKKTRSESISRPLKSRKEYCVFFIWVL